MKRWTWARWSVLQAGDLFQTADDLHPLRVLEVRPRSVVVYQGGRCWEVFFRVQVRVKLFF